MGYRWYFSHPIASVLVAWAKMRIYPFTGVCRFMRGWVLFTKSSTYYLGPGDSW